ncbi:MAG TPA: hypothetical protein DCY94_04320 [Firmicutes bacterium]|nr:hypothetical protein [Bacillota bacterium]
MLDYVDVLSRGCTFKASWSVRNNIPVGIVQNSSRRTSIVNDDVFQMMMNNESRIEYPCMLLSLIFGLNYEDLLKNARFYKEFIDTRKFASKREIADCMIVYRDTIFSIEMNCTNTLMRNQDYIHRAATVKNRRGERKYKTMNYCQVNLNNFSLKGHDEVYEVYKTIDERGDLYGYQFFVNVFLLNLRDKYYNDGIKALSKCERYIMGLVETSKARVSELKKGSKILMEYDRELKYAFMDGEVELGEPIDRKAEMMWVIEHNAREDGLEEGKLFGRAEGEAKAYSVIAKHLLSKGMTLDMVADYMNMPVSKVKNLYISESDVPLD